MLYNIYQFVHESLGLCFWDIPALIVAALMVIVALVHPLNHGPPVGSSAPVREENLEALRS